MIKTENFEQVEVSSAAQLRSWLEENHTQKDSGWLVTFKKSVPEKYVSTSDVLDEDRTMQLISPRKAEHWAGTYKTRAAQLIAEERS